MEYKAVIFDLDGVLCYTDHYHYLAWKQIAGEKGIYFDEEINKRLRGVSRMESLDIILERADTKYTKAQKEGMAERKNSTYRALLNSLSEKDMAKGVLDTLRILKNKGIKTAVGSSSKNAVFILQKLGLMEWFDVVVDGTMISHSKPHPEVFIKAADLLDERPYDCLVVEDAAAGIEAANAGGFASAGIGDAQGHPKAAYKISELSEILGLV